jgi:hypothetical protein
MFLDATCVGENRDALKLPLASHGATINRPCEWVLSKVFDVDAIGSGFFSL